MEELPLQIEEFAHIDPATGCKITGKRFVRGILGMETRYFNADNALAFKPVNPRKRLDALREHLRDRLEALGLPSDRQPRWIRDHPEAEWRVATEADFDGGHQLRRGFATWSARAKQIARPLSRGWLAADLLESLNDLLERPGIDDHLWHICQVMEHYYSYQVGGDISQLAVSGWTARKGRTAGPLARRKRAGEVREVIREVAQAYWVDHHLLREDRSNTALAISGSVNDKLGERGLLGRDGKALSTRTIAGHIAAIVRG